MNRQMLVSRYGVMKVHPRKTTKLPVRIVEIGTLDSRKLVRSEIAWSTLPNVHLVWIPWPVFRALGHLTCCLATNLPTMNCPREPNVYHVTIDMKLRVSWSLKHLDYSVWLCTLIRGYCFSVLSSREIHVQTLRRLSLGIRS